MDELVMVRMAESRNCKEPMKPLSLPFRTRADASAGHPRLRDDDRICHGSR